MRKFYLLSVSILAMTVAMPALAAGTKAAAPASSPTTASDYGFFFKPYVGADYQYSSYGDKDFGGYKSSDVFQTGLNGGDVHVGARIHKYVGVEASYFQTEQGSKSNVLNTGINSSDRIKGGALDVMGYWPIADKAELIGTTGVSYSKVSGTLSIPGTSVSAHTSEWKARVGAGAQYWLTDNLNARALVRYQDASFDGDVAGAVVSTVGLNWQF